MFLTKRITALITIALISLGEAYRVLLIFPTCAKSHTILANAIIDNLVDAGHQVVHMTCHPHKKIIENVTEIDVSFIGEKFINVSSQDEGGIKLKDLVGKSNMVDSFIFNYLIYLMNYELLHDKTVIDFLSDKDHQFDVVMAEWMFSELTAGIAPLFQCPLIWICTTPEHWQALRAIDEMPNPAYSEVPTNDTPLGIVDHVTVCLTLVKKLMYNVIIHPLELYTYYTAYPPIAAKRGVTMPSYSEAAYNGSLMFINSHPSYSKSTKVPQNAVYIGGYHINGDPEPLPKDLQKVMDDAQEGMIFFSMGSNLQSKHMSPHMKDSLLKVFSKLKQKVIWKFEGKMDNLPENVLLLNWAPQQSILAHPNTKIFITHGGQLSTTEAIHYGVPVIGLPVYGDQFVNTKSAEIKGFGIKVTLAEDMAFELEKAIQDILTNPSFTHKAKQLSSIYHNRLVSPQKELVYWVEQVVETQGLPHLRSPAPQVYIPFYQKAYLDIILLTALVLYLLYKIVKKLCCKKNKDSVKVKQN